MTARFAVGMLMLAGMTSWAMGQEAGSAEMREWKDKTGRYTIQAKFVGLQDGIVQLEKADGGTASVPLDKLCSEDQQLARELGGDQAPGKAKELKYDDGKAADKQSFPGGGHTVRFTTPYGNWVLTAVKLFGSRYGMPMPPKEDFLIWVCDKDGKRLKELKIPYKTFTRGPEKWVTMKVPPTPVPNEFLLCFYFNAEATKGIYVGYDAEASGNSLAGVPEDGFQSWKKGDWMIRALVEPAQEKPTP